VISVGNLTFGGTGKTPVTLALVRFLREAGERPAVLLRGYGRRSKGPLPVLPSSPPEEVGEESLLYLRAIPDLPVAVSERREEGAALLLSFSPTLFLLDDGFQHVGIARDLDLLLVDTTRPRDLLPPPVGRLREPLSGASRADALLLSGGGSLPEALTPFAADKPALSVRFRWAEEPSLSVPPGLSWKAFSGRPVAAFAGVGSPGRFLRDLQSAGLPPLRFLAFPDHAFPTAGRLEALKRVLRETRAEAVLTTEKDAVKWAPRWPFEVPLVWPRLEAVLDHPGVLLPTLLQEALRRGRP
jgi:tetraacyldisaccharide 4'-kinase